MVKELVGLWRCCILVFCFAALVVGKSQLLDEKKLNSSCFSVPGSDFGYYNNVRTVFGSSPFVHRTRGQAAIDFTLSTPSGHRHRLSTFLQSKPVLMLWGHHTCPAYNDYKGSLYFANCSYSYENALAEKYHKKIHVLHIISVEPHPMYPYANFDWGTVRMNLWSDIPQPQSYKEKLQLSVPPVQSLTSDKITILIDKLDGAKGTFNHPVWCSYATGARSAILIDQNGKIQFTQSWFESYAMSQAIESLVS